MTREELINVFNETRDLSLSIYKTDTMRAKENTEVIIDGLIFLQDLEVRDQKIEVVMSGTIATALGVASKRVAILNFADPYQQGGLVFDGETTQEEDICRCTNLFETLIKQDCWERYYLYNRSLEDNIFSNRLIYSKDITIFKDEEYNIVPFSPKVDVISCPAPVSCNDLAIFEKRIRCIIGSAYNNGVDTLVLGKWGCGAFDNDSTLVATAFKNVLDDYKIFDRVIFACLDDSESTQIFQQVLLG